MTGACRKDEEFVMCSPGPGIFLDRRAGCGFRAAQLACAGEHPAMPWSGSVAGGQGQFGRDRGRTRCDGFPAPALHLRENACAGMQPGLVGQFGPPSHGSFQPLAAIEPEHTSNGVVLGGSAGPSRPTSHPTRSARPGRCDRHRSAPGRARRTAARSRNERGRRAGAPGRRPDRQAANAGRGRRRRPASLRPVSRAGTATRATLCWTSPRSSATSSP
jgi:hypothetical protein